jgi:hypothetical protein
MGDTAALGLTPRREVRLVKHCHRPFTIFAAACALLAATVPATPTLAQVWNEVADAGDLPWTVQSPAGLYAINQINGALQFDADVDLYCIEVLNPPAFSASLQCAGASDPSIWIFHFTGLGVTHNDVCSFAGKTIPPGIVGFGTYYVAVAPFGRQAMSSGGDLWQNALFTGPRAPDGPGVGNNLIGWSGAVAIPGVTPYTINFTGASYCGTAVPEEAHSWGALKATYR